MSYLYIVGYKQNTPFIHALRLRSGPIDARFTMSKDRPAVRVELVAGPGIEPSLGDYAISFLRLLGVSDYIIPD